MLMRYAIVALLAAVCLAGCGSSSTSRRAGVAPVTTTATVTATTTATTATAPSGPGYLNATTLAHAVVVGYNHQPPAWAIASSGSCAIDQATLTATCTLQTNHGRVVEPVSIAPDGSNFATDAPGAP